MFNFFKIKKPEVIAQSPINKTLSIGTSYGHKTLFADNIQQSGGEFVTMWKQVIQKVCQNGTSPPKEILVLGVGAGTVIFELRHKYPDRQITAIEIDPVILNIAESHFGLKPTPFMHLITADAIKWIKTNADKKYGLIFVDIFIGLVNPRETRSSRFLKNLSQILEINGTLIINWHFDPNNPHDFDRIIKLCQDRFNKIDIVFSFLRNKVVLLKNHL